MYSLLRELKGIDIRTKPFKTKHDQIVFIQNLIVKLESIKDDYDSHECESDHSECYSDYDYNKLERKHDDQCERIDDLEKRLKAEGKPFPKRYRSDEEKSKFQCIP